MSFKTTKEILVHIFNGGKVINSETEEVVFLKENGNINKNYSFIRPGDWQPYEEPKKKVKLYKWTYQKPRGEWIDTNQYYRNEEDFITNVYLSEDTEFLRLDYTMIEVDEE